MQLLLLLIASFVISLVCALDGKFKGKVEESVPIYYLSNSWMMAICIFIVIVILFNISLICYLQYPKGSYSRTKCINDDERNDSEREQLPLKE